MTQSISSSIYSSAESHFLAGRLETARQELQDALELDADAGRLWELLGVVHYTQCNYREAVQALEQASLLIPLAYCSQYVLAICYGKQDLASTADTIYQHLATVQNLDEHLLEPVASALGRNGHSELALQVCSEAAKRMPDETEPLMGMIFYMQRLGRPVEQILSTMFRAFHLNPEDTDCRMALARTLFECGRNSEAAHLLAELPIEEFRCLSCLAVMKTIFSATGDKRNVARCMAARQSLSRGHR